MIFVLYARKKKVMTLENYLCTAMFISLLVQLVINNFNFMITVPLWSRVTKQLHNAMFIVWGGIVTLYFISTVSKENQGYVAFKDNPKREYFLSFIKKFIIILVALFLPALILNQTPDETTGLYMVSHGPAPIYCYAVFGVFILSWFVIFFRIKDKKEKKKFMSMGYVILIGIIGAIAQIFVPHLYITCSITALASATIYFNIANPDLNLIEELNMTKESAERANKAKSDFLSSMSHEIRTPLNAIVGFSEALYEEELPEEQKDEVNIITTSATNLLEIVNGILDISKMEAGKLEVTNKDYILNKLVNDVVITAKRYLQDNKVEFKITVNDKLPQVLNGDIVKLKSILTNLLINSIKYTEVGTINLDVDGIVLDNKCRLIINVEDSGKGIDDSVIPHLFTSYQLGDRAEGLSGSGLGVAVTKGLVELMGGKIHVKSGVGVGTSFIFALEQNIIAKTSNEVEGIFAEELSIFDASDKRILVVDDNGVNLKVAKRLLKDYKATVDLASSGKECIALIDSGKKYDLIMMDDFMPEMDGPSTLKNLKQRLTFKTPVIALTANNESGSKDKYLSLGFNNYLSKPIAKEELNKVLKEFLS
jgi:signal transduction histidine kinase/CheY-like chemotaxis protein